MPARRHEDYLAQFARRHNLRRRLLLDTQSKAIHWASAAKVLISHGYSQLTDTDLSREPAVGLLLNLLHRAFEHLEASIVALVTGSSASSEALSRVTMELSVTISYILAGPREARLVAFFQNYMDGEQKRLKNWAHSVEAMPVAERGVHEHAIEHRRVGVKEMEHVLELLKREIADSGSILDKHTWPNVADRFEALGEAVAYRTVYSRMSSQIHSDAEETIRCFVVRTCNNQELLGRMAQETIWFTKFLLYFAVKYYLDACLAFARVYGMNQELAKIEYGQSIIERELGTISAHVDA